MPDPQAPGPIKNRVGFGLKKKPQTRSEFLWKPKPNLDPTWPGYIYIFTKIPSYIYIYIVINPKISIPHFISAHSQTAYLSSLQLTNTTLTHKSQSHSLSISLPTNYLTSLRRPSSHHRSNSRRHPNLSPPSQAFTATQALSVSLTHRRTRSILFSTSLHFFFFYIDVLGLFYSVAKSKIFDFSLHLPKSLRGFLWVNYPVLYLVGILLISWICQVPFPKQRYVF